MKDGAPGLRIRGEEWRGGMRRKQEPGLLEGLFELACRMPWWLGLAVAIVSFAWLHGIAIRPQVASPGADDAGTAIARQVWRTAAAFGQVIVPLLFAAAAGISAIRARRKKRLQEPDRRP